MNHRLRVLRTAGEIGEIAPQWRGLIHLPGYAMSDPEWFGSAALMVAKNGNEPRVLALLYGEELLAVAPLVAVKGAGGFRYEILGSRTLHEPAEILAADDEANRRIAAAVVDLRRPVLLGRLPSNARFIDAFRSVATQSGWVLSPVASGSPYIDLAGGWDGYYASLPSRIRNILRRAARALGRVGYVEFEFIRAKPAEVSALLEEAFKVELQSWKGRAGSAILQRPDLRDFFTNYGAAVAEHGELLVSFLRLDGAAIAMQVASIGRNSYRQLKIGYDDRYAKYLPGLQLLLETIRWSYGQKPDSYEFMGSREPWTREWTQQVREHKTLAFYPFTAVGFGVLAWDYVRRVWGKIATLNTFRAGQRHARKAAGSADQ